MAASKNILRHSLLQIGLIVIVVFAVFVVLGILMDQAGDSRRKERLAALGAEQRAAGLSAYFTALGSHLQAQGRDPRLIALLQDADVTAEAARIAAGFTGGIGATIVPMPRNGIADLTFDRDKFRNNIEIDQVARAFAGNISAFEAYQQDGHWLLGVAAPVAPNANAWGSGGALLLTLDAGAALSAALADNAGQVSVLSGGREVFRQGSSDAAVASDSVSIPGAALSLVFHPSAAQIDEDKGAGAMPLLGGAAIAGVCLLLLIVWLFSGLRRSLNSDVEILLGIARKQRKSTAALPSLAFREMVPLGEAMLELLRRAAGPESRAQQGTATVRSPRVEAAALDPANIDLSEVEGEDDSLELELDEPLAIPEHVFRAYDIRGREQDLDDRLVQHIGQAIGSEAQARDNRSVAVGADGRNSSPRIREALVKGLLDSGCDVVDVGTVATPMLYFAANHLQTNSGVMVTGSHNGPEFNGLKVMIAGETLAGDDIQALMRRVENADFVSGQGNYRVSDINANYIDAVNDDIVLSGNPKIVVDCGNGAAAVIAGDLFEALGAQVVLLFDDLDGDFPNHPPDPSDPRNMRQLAAAVTEHGADLGLAFDGDGDRIGVIDSRGRIVAADRLLMIFARDLLSRHPGADVVFDVKCSRHLARVVSEAGGRPVMWRSGHSWIKAKMKQSGALLGGEFTGHICFKERWYGFDDALYCAARLLEILGLEDRSLQDMVDELPQAVSTPEILLPVADSDKFALMDRVRDVLSFPDAKLITLDGVRAEFDDGWGIVRVSNTGAALTARFEADDSGALQRIQQAFRDRLDGLIDTAPL